MIRIPIRRGTGLSIFVVVFLLSSCVQVRLLTYPSSFTWIGAEDVQNTMHAMASNMKKIDVLIADEKNPGSNQQAVVEVLSDIEYLAADLSVQTPGSDSGDKDLPATNHLLIDEHMDEFLESVYRAKVQAEATPPSYYGAGKLTGSCSACHRYR